jgi:DNA mismatch endonuclease (patch repair protein)
MTDVFTKTKRSEIMSKIRSVNTKPEISIKNFLRKSNASFEMHPNDILGKPDMVNRKKKVAIFIDGCFWHGCKTCRTIPKDNRPFWKNKINYNRARRIKVKKLLKKEGWNVMEFWEHEVNKNPKKVVSSIIKKLNG